MQYSSSVLSQTQGFKWKKKWSFGPNHETSKLKRPKMIFDKIKRHGHRGANILFFFKKKPSNISLL